MNQSSRRLVAAMAILLPAFATAQDFWFSPDGKAIPETPARKARNGFGVTLLITADPDWQAKWDTPSYVAPNFNETKTVSIGGRLSILTLVVNPKPDVSNTLNVSSQIEVTRPNGTSSVNTPGLLCLGGKLTGPASAVRLCDAVIQFSADPGDPVGSWKVKVTVRDENRAIEIPVEGSFELLSQ